MMDAGTARSTQVVASIITAIGTIILILLYAVPILRRLPASSYAVPGVVALVVFAAVLGYLTFPAQRLLAYRLRRKPGKIVPVPPDMARDLLAYVAQAKRVWASQAMYSDSFFQVSLDIMNAINQEISAIPNTRMFADQANGVIAAYRVQRPIYDELWESVDALAQTGVDMDKETLRMILNSVVAISTAGANLANHFAQCASNGGISLQKHLHDEWGTFAAKANRLADDLLNLGEKVKQTYHVDPKSYVPPVRGL